MSNSAFSVTGSGGGGTGTVTNVTATSPLTSSGGVTPNIALPDSGVTPGTYGNFTVNASGLITAATSLQGLISFQYLTSGSAATYTKNPAAKNILIEILGGGGGGGGASSSPGTASGGGGGGSGAYCRLWIPSASATYLYSVGSGGAGGIGASSGSNGGNSTFSIVTAGGGIAGTGIGGNSPPAASGPPGDGGLGSGGDINIGGLQGGFGFIFGNGTFSGFGANSFFGGGGLVVDIPSGASNGNAGTVNSGGGGSGGASVNNGGTATGGNGGSGLIIVWEFS